jgi:hypothetical protein
MFIASENIQLGYSSRDTQAPLFQFKGDESYLQNIQDLPDNLGNLQFNPWKSVTLANHDTCKLMSFVSLKSGVTPAVYLSQESLPIGQIMAIYTPLASNIAVLPPPLKSLFLIVDIYTKSSQSRAYKMPKYKYSKHTIIIHPEVSSFHVLLCLLTA